jgi:hypothetical protein
METLNTTLRVPATSHDCGPCHDTDLVVRVRKTPEDWKKTVYEMADRGVDA